MKKNQKITDIQNKNTKRRKIYLDNGLSMETHVDIVLELDLYIGKTITEDIIKLIQEKDELIKAKNDAIRFLSYRPRSQWEITKKLQNNHYQSGIINQTIQWLQEKSLINDRDFSLSWIKDRINKKPLGKIKLRSELYHKGIDKEIIEEVINDFFSKEDDELELAYHLIRQKKSSFLLKQLPFEPRKMIYLLKSRGFSNHIIERIYHELSCQ